MYKNGNPVWSLWLNGERFDRNIIGMEGDFSPQEDIKLFHTLDSNASSWDNLFASHVYHYVIENTAGNNYLKSLMLSRIMEVMPL